MLLLRTYFCCGDPCIFRWTCLTTHNLGFERQLTDLVNGFYYEILTAFQQAKLMNQDIFIPAVVLKMIQCAYWQCTIHFQSYSSQPTCLVWNQKIWRTSWLGVWLRASGGASLRPSKWNWMSSKPPTHEMHCLKHSTLGCLTGWCRWGQTEYVVFLCTIESYWEG